jgi:lipid-binding SYLF domain-containing protein
MNRSILLAVVLAAATLGMTGCSTAPPSEEKKDALHDAAQLTLKEFYAEDPSLRSFLDKSYGYVDFPSVGKGGFIFGGAYGRGEVYRGGELIGYADISQGSVGLQAGGQTFAEVIAFENKEAFDRFTNNRLEPTAQASAVILKSGAAASAKYANGVAIFVKPKSGAMVEASVGGQQFTFTPIRK